MDVILYRTVARAFANKTLTSLHTFFCFLLFCLRFTLFILQYNDVTIVVVVVHTHMHVRKNNVIFFSLHFFHRPIMLQHECRHMFVKVVTVDSTNSSNVSPASRVFVWILNSDSNWRFRMQNRLEKWVLVARFSRASQ